MIDFPTLFPNLAKYIPNWMERFYPRMAQFARGEGYPCGNKGVFIPRRNNCWTHPKTGNRLTKPLTYQKYQEAKEKSQKSRTEKGRTALQDREQGFRDKAREKVKGWQNKNVETEVKQTPKKGEEFLKKLSSSDYYRDHSGIKEIARAIDENDGIVDTGLSKSGKASIAPGGGIMSGKVEILKLEEPNTARPWGTAVIKIDGKEQKVNLSNLANGVRYQLNKASQKQDIPVEKKQRVTGRTMALSRQKELEKTSEGQTLLEAEKDFEKTVKGTRLLNERKFDEAATAKNKALVNHNAKQAYDLPDQDQKDYDAKQPAEINLSSGLGMMEGWRSKGFEKYLNTPYDKRSLAPWDSRTTGIPWSVKVIGREDPRIIAGAKVRDVDQKTRVVELYDTEGLTFLSHFRSGDRVKSDRARRLVKEIAEGKSRDVDLNDIHILIENGEDGFKKSTEGKQKAVEDERRQEKDWDDFLSSENYSKDDYEKLDKWKKLSAVYRFEKIQKSKKQPKKNDFNSNLALTNFGNTNMRRRELKLANFASYPCGNKGVFIPSSKNCYTHPKTGVKLDKPLKFKDYTQARKEAFQKSKAGGELTETEQQLVQDVNRLQGKVSDKRRAKELNSAAKRMGAKAILPSGIAEADPNKIKVDPKRFQYKIIGEQTKSGEVGSLSGVKKWDANLGGILQVWRDPRNGDVNVVNGHNRLALAKKLNAPSVTVKLIDAKTPQEARAIGALTNIAEGRGNAQDAAKFFRDSGVTKQELEKKGVPMREKIAEDGLALSNLSDSLFNRVVQGQIPEQRAVVIGTKIKDHRQQQDLLELVEKEEKRGKKITNDTIEELSDMVTNAPSKTESQGGLFDLLGFSPESRSLAVEKAQIQSAIKRQLSGDKRLFSTVGKSKAAQNLEKAGNKINVEESNEIADTAGKALSAFDQEKMLTGKVSDYLNQAAERLAGNQKGRDKIIKETYEQVLDELQKTYRFGKGASSKGTDGLSAIDREEKAIQDEKRKQYEKAKKAGQIDSFTASANLRLAKFSKPGCCCEASKPLKRRKTKQTPRLKRRGNRYA